MRWGGVAIWVVTVALGASRARAESELPSDVDPADWKPTSPPPAPKPAVHQAGYHTRPVHLELLFGADTRVGELGVSLEYNLGNPLALGVGVGTNSLGAAWAAHARARPIWWQTANGNFFHALTIEGSVSRAGYNSGIDLSALCDCTPTGVVAQTVYWAQGEVGWEGMLGNGFSFRASSGLASAIGSRHWQCLPEDPTCHPPPRQLYVQTFALGVAF